MNRPSMWQRILAWQSSDGPAEPREIRIVPTGREAADTVAPETFMAAFIATQKSGVAVERELAKVMW